MKIKFSDIKGARSSEELETIINEIMDLHSSGDAIYLSDVIANVNIGGDVLMEEIGTRAIEENDLPYDERQYKWRIKVMRDEWGNEPVPGEYYTRKINKRPKDKYGRPINGDVLSAMKKTGEYDEKFTRTQRFKIDNKGCVTVPFEAAGSMLNLHGIHGKTRKPLTTKDEHSREPVEVPGSSDKLHVWYWRFFEVDDEMWEALPDLTEAKNNNKGTQKRGTKKANDEQRAY
jgi:hypothetical protein